ncbi:GtrA family protein [Bacillus infantis]|jgi:putative flippase GtrA|uniref:GtrA family protein n=1 Tax=Bacillus infantis TaxID=324767 RepID=UPI0021550D54|nr:GtrA family protein [Bacillus infantis]MCR6609703.1 GtrA family protein [Bacillus infantis]
MRFIRSEFFRFAMTGGVNTLHYYSIYLVLLHWAGFHYFLAHSIGFASSLIGSFFLNTLFTYRVKPTWVAFIRFPLTQLFNTGMTAVILFILVDGLKVSSSLSPVIAVVFTLPATFILTGRVLKTSCKKREATYQTY